MQQLTRKFWTDFDFHRNKFESTLNKIKNITWVEVDSNKYNSLKNKEERRDLFSCMLRSSRYDHGTSKCFPTSSTCHRCYKYFCPCCNEGSNSMYLEACTNIRCLRAIHKYNSSLFEIESTPQSIYMLSTESMDSYFNKKTFCSKDVYGY